MILNKEQVKANFEKDEAARRAKAKKNTVHALTTEEINARMKTYISKEELKAEKKRRAERLRYARLMANPKSRAALRDKKRAQRAKNA
jgi:hypothetical protein